ncbi:TPA: hypothetical protein VB895_001261 [Streptococcus suis]|nr:hypothetical protein [Streptococcus suis]HEP1827934.1 hypothetical protein [Streptococcus suis]
MLPEHEKRRIKQEIQNSKSDPIQKLLVQKIRDLSNEIAVMASNESRTWIEAIKRLDNATKWVDPNYQASVKAVSNLAKIKLESIALKKY